MVCWLASDSGLFIPKKISHSVNRMWKHLEQRNYVEVRMKWRSLGRNGNRTTLSFSFSHLGSHYTRWAISAITLLGHGLQSKRANRIKFVLIWSFFFILQVINNLSKLEMKSLRTKHLHSGNTVTLCSYTLVGTVYIWGGVYIFNMQIQS